MREVRVLLTLGLVLVMLMVIESRSIRRAEASTLTVTNLNDSGAGSLRQAITTANNTLAIDTINFNISGPGVKSIRPLTPLPVITAPVIIDGTTQPGWSEGNLRIELDGENAGALADGLSFSNILDTSATSFVRGLVINRWTNAGIATQVTNNLTIEGCYIGTDVSGTTAQGNTVGVLLQSTIGGFHSSNITVGGDTSAERNIISGNSFMGIRIFGGNDHIISGNYIGTDKTGTVALGDQSGLDITGIHITVGGSSAALRNVISGNSSRGMTVNGFENTVQGNYIGVAVDGTAPLGNGLNGIVIIGDGLTNNDHLIGGTAAGEGNIIANNIGDGIRVFRDVRPTTGHRFLGNSIYANTADGIDLDQNGVTPNDSGDGDDGTNNLQNFPVLTSALYNGSTTTITGTLNSDPGISYRIEFFANSSCDPTGHGEGQTFLGFVNVATNGSGNASINTSLSVNTSFGQYVTATSTRLTAPLDTSEFSACVPVTLQEFVVTNTNNAGSGSLRQAITDANANSNPNLISFDIPGAGVHTISLTSGLPNISTPIAIDGLSQPGAACNAPLIELDGTNAGAGLDGLLFSSSNSLVQGLVINRFNSDGITLLNGQNNTVRCNRIGVSVDGNTDLGNGGNGVLISGASGNTVTENTISGNALSGIRFVSASSNTIQGNIIGLSSDGLTKIANSAGINFFTAGTANLIGGPTAAARNVISGNNIGISIRDAGVTNNSIVGNFIGVNPSGSGAGFGNGDGIQILLGANGTVIGGVSPGEGNVIAHNSARGIVLVNTSGNGNKILGNSIHSNGSPTNFLGIDLNADGVTNNDAGDGDAAANNSQNFPIITTAETFPGIGTTITGSLNSAANNTYRLEFFTNPACDALGHGEGQTFLASAEVTTDSSGNANFNLSVAIDTAVGETMTATATRKSAPFDTSEFSACQAITALAPTDLFVTNTDDSGAGSLRNAILLANNDPLPERIVFNIPGPGVKTITPTTPLPQITHPVVIDGLSQPGAACGQPIIELNGTNAGAGADGLNIAGGHSTVQGLVINSFNGDGVEFNTIGGNSLKCSRIGTNQAGLAPSANGSGVFLNSVNDNVIGGTANDGNLISGNTTNGILIDGATGADNNVIQGNFIGVTSLGTGLATIRNLQDGVRLQGEDTTNTLIGGSVAGAGNVISNNGDDGIEIVSAVNTIIKGNLIGVASTGNTAAGNLDCGIFTNASLTVGGTALAERNIISANVKGIQLFGGTTTGTIQGNYFGLGADGLTTLGNDLGVFVNSGTNVLIGGTAPGAGNVISGNSSNGIFLQGSNNIVQGNLIGTDATGLLDRGNGDGSSTGAGISVGSANQLIGGPTSAARNVISGNLFGISMALTNGDNITVQNNYIGTNVSGTGPLGNTKAGIIIASDNNLIGGIAGQGNTIAFNGQNGVGILQGLGNRITANSIFSNNLRGIDLGNNGVFEPNDTLDADTGANGLQNFPVITSSSISAGPTVNIQGSLHSVANASFQIDFYSNPACDNSGNGEGQVFLGSTNVNTNASGNVSFAVSFNANVPSGHIISATATDTANNTSEFSFCPAPTANDGLIAGRVTATDGITPISGAVIQLAGSQSRKTITDANGNYHFADVETGGFYTITISRANFLFSPSERSFNLLANQTEAVFSGSYLGENANPIDTPEYFVRQQYVDVLGREPDESGFNYWSDQILACGDELECRRQRRTAVAAAFFIEQEFQRSGSFIYDTYAGALTRKPRFNEYTGDRQGISEAPSFDAGKQSFVENLVSRPEFVSKYDTANSAESFVAALLANAELSGTSLESERASFIALYGQGSSLVESRARVIRALAEAPAFRQSQHNGGFVLTEYFGYLRRNPDSGGYNFWLNVLNENPQNFNGMVCSFIRSTEYQRRFSTVVSHSNAECGQ